MYTVYSTSSANGKLLLKTKEKFWSYAICMEKFTVCISFHINDVHMRSERNSSVRNECDGKIDHSNGNGEIEVRFEIRIQLIDKNVSGW